MNDARTTQELIAGALGFDSESDEYWDIVVELQHRPTPDTLRLARQLCSGRSARERELGANILAQLGAGSNALHEERLQALLALLESEPDQRVLSSAAIALGHLRDERAVLPLLRLKEHPSETVRYGVVHGLLGQHAPEAVAALVQLSADVDSHVRDWATFELGTILDDVDTPEVREALFARIEDPDDDTRAEALVGLAKRKDERVIEPLIKELRSPSVGSLAVEAAGLVADKRLCPPLLELRDELGQDAEVDEAIHGCGCSSEDEKS